MSDTDTLIAEWERAQRGALEFLDAASDPLLSYRPAPESLTFAGQYLHIAEANYMFGSAAAGCPNPNQVKNAETSAELTGSREALRAFVSASYDFLMGCIRNIDPAAFGEPAQFFRHTLPRHLILSKALEHHAHHRGQTAVYFRLNGMKPPSERLF